MFFAFLLAFLLVPPFVIIPIWYLGIRPATKIHLKILSQKRNTEEEVDAVYEIDTESDQAKTKRYYISKLENVLAILFLPVHLYY